MQWSFLDALSMYRNNYARRCNLMCTLEILNAPSTLKLGQNRYWSNKTKLSEKNVERVLQDA